MSESTTDKPTKSSSPRPTFDGPTHIRHADATLHLWGDDGSGEVADWIYVSSDKIHHLVFGLAPGQSFGHTDNYRTVFAADELLYVLSGTLVFINPETGEVQKAGKGEAVFFRRDTWHHAVAFGPEALRVAEFFAPPPSTGASSAYARTKDLLIDVRHGDDRWIGSWPMARSERAEKQTIEVIREADTLWRLDGDALCGICVSTEHLTGGRMVVPPGGKTTEHAHQGDATLHVLEGVVNVLVKNPADGEQSWFELKPDDGFYAPEGTVFQVRNVTAENAELLFAVAPQFG